MSEPIALPDLATSAKLGAALARLLRPGDVVALAGELGAGKTSLVRAILSAMAGAALEVPSPTYTLVQTYSIAGHELYHFDLYRLTGPAELDELGWEDTVDGIALIEWPDRAGPRLPAWRLDISLDMSGQGRIARLEPHGEDWQSRLNEFCI